MNWGLKNIDSYVAHINHLLIDFETKEKANAEKIAKRKSKGNIWAGDIKNLTFKEIPMEICVDNLGFVVTNTRNCIRSHREIVDYNHYSHWVNELLTSGKISVETLATLWHDYDVAKRKALWMDFGKIAKDFNSKNIWNRFSPTDESNISDIIANPWRIVYFLNDDTKFKWWSLTDDERNEVKAHFAEPEVNKSIQKKLKSIVKALNEIRPTVGSACEAYMNDLFCNSYGENDITWNTEYGDRSMWAPREREERTWYGNRSNYADGDIERSMKNIISKAIDEAFPNLNDRLAAFQAGLHVTVNDEGNHHSDHSDIFSSSFWTYYYNDFSVDIDVYRRDDKFHKKFENVLVSSSYYSGGW